MLVLWSNVSASVDAASPGTAHTKKGSRAKGEREKGRCTSTWAIRVNQCQGGSLHIGCVSNAYKSSNAYAESKEWGMVAVMGEAYNLRHTAYFLGSSGQVRTRTHTHARIYAHTRTHSLTQTNILTQAYTHKHEHASIHTPAYTHVHHTRTFSDAHSNRMLIKVVQRHTCHWCREGIVTSKY